MFTPRLLALAISACTLSSALQAQTFEVTVSTDNGLADTPGTLSYAIRQANDPNGQPGRASGSVGTDTIELMTDVLLTGASQALIDSDIILNGNGRSISGNDIYRPLFIRSGQVTLNNFTVRNGLAAGLGSREGGSGAGLGGGLFIYDGQVTINNVNFDNNRAIGGQTNNAERSYGGGGMQRSQSDSLRPSNARNSGGSLFGDGAYGRSNSQIASGNYGGAFSRTQPTVRRAIEHGGFGAAGHYGGNSGFGAGGSYGNESPSQGGFGGGGAGSYYTSRGNSDGGFGGGGGTSLVDPHLNGLGGFGASQVAASNRDGAGLGGAIFIRSGQLTINKARFNNNRALSPGQQSASAAVAASNNDSQGYGGAVFALHRLTNTNGNNRQMPDALPSLNLCQVIYGIDNQANFASHLFTASNNDENSIAQNSADLFVRTAQLSHSASLAFSAGNSQSMTLSERQPHRFSLAVNGCHSGQLSWQVITPPRDASLTINGNEWLFTPHQSGNKLDMALVEVRDDINGFSARVNLSFTLPAAMIRPDDNEPGDDENREPGNSDNSNNENMSSNFGRGSSWQLLLGVCALMLARRGNRRRLSESCNFLIR